MKKHAFHIYNASAGSGKTYSLVKEYMKIILTARRNDTYKTILAITFTNKAVEEMKSRIVSTLEQFSMDDPHSKAEQMLLDIARDTGLTPTQIKEKSRLIIKSIIHNYASFDISTIDKFTHRVIRSFALELGLPLSFEVSLDTESLLAEAVDSVIAQAGQESELTKVLVDFATEKADDDKSWDLTFDFLSIGKLLTNENNKSEVGLLQEKSIQDFMKIKNNVQKTLKDIEQEVVLKAVDTLNLISDNGVEFKSFFSGYIPKFLQKIADGNLDINTNHYKYLDPNDPNAKAPYSKSVPQDQKDRIDALAPDVLEAMKFINKNIGKSFFYRALLKNLTPLSVLNTINQELLKIQHDQNIVSISEFNSIIHDQIKEQPAPFIYEKLGDRYTHFFIDEFQDTSKMQWENLIPLIDNALAGEDHTGTPGSLMIVGDPKQSIYRWRGGRAEQFINLSLDHPKDYPFSNPDRAVINLDTNYRSYSNIITFNNELFTMLADEFTNEDYQNIYRNASQKTNSNLGGCVSLSFLDEAQLDDTITEDELYLQHTLDAINRCVENGFEYKDIVVLIRKNAQGVLIANHLTQNNIPIVSSETLLLNNSDHVRLLLHVLEFLKNKNNQLEKAKFLYYLGRRIKATPIHDFIASGMKQQSEAAFQNWLSDYHIHFRFEDIRKKSLYEACEIIIETFLQKSNDVYLQSFLDIVLEQNMRNQSSIDDFLDYWKKNGHKISIPSPKGNAVQIMTIHKSKGLEYPVVIFPFADQDYRHAPKDKLWIENPDETIELEKILVDHTSKVESYTDTAGELLKEKDQEKLLDQINVLYVALTRAVEQLHIISKYTYSSKGDLEDTMARYFIQYLDFKQQLDTSKLYYQFGDLKRLSTVKDTTSNSEAIKTVADKFDAQHIKIASQEAIMWDSTQIQAIELGNLTHKILSLISSYNDIDSALETSCLKGWITLDQQDFFHEMIEKIVHHPELKEFYNPSYFTLNERAIVRKEFAIAKPDKIVLMPSNQVMILDYKTGAEQDKYKQQLDNYALALEEMGYNVTRKTLVYIQETIKIKNL